MFFTQLLIIKYEYNSFTAYFKEIKDNFINALIKEKQKRGPILESKYFP